MEVIGYCQNCNHSFDAHWTLVEENKQMSFLRQPWCPICNSKQIAIRTDESNDYESDNGDDYDEY